MKKPIRLMMLGGLGLLGLGYFAALSAQGKRNVDYPWTGGDPGAMRYSTLTQINAKNVGKLKEVWRRDLGGPGQVQNQPIVVGGVLYGVGLNGAYAVNAATGAPKWEYKPEGPMGRRNARGAGFWTDGKERRLLLALGNFVVALNADTGKEIPGFGKEGRIDLNDQLRGPAANNNVNMSSPVTIYQDIFITCGGVGEQSPASPGDIRGWDVRSGRLLWTFHTIPHPGEPGAETWPKDAYLTAGGANAWAGTTLDAKRGIVFVTTGSPSDDYYGGERLGDNLYSDSLVALDAKTGKKLWHYQVVHHDLWDADFATAPSLATITRNGKPVDVVVATNKTSYIWVFNRETGESMFPIDEKPVPPITVDGDVAAKTQPVPRMPPPLSWTAITENDLTNRSPEARAFALEKLRSFVNGPQFTPVAFGKETIVAPGFSGGVEWGGIMIDPKAQVGFFNAENIVWSTALTEQLAAGGGGKKGGGAPAMAGPRSRYTHTGYHKFYDQDGYPATAPPWGTLTAVDLNTGKFLWRVPLGEYPELAEQGMKNTGSENYGAGVVTASGLLFIGSTIFDSKLRAFDTKTGKVIWDTTLPYPGNASAITYMVNGRQYVAIATSSGRNPKAPRGSALVVYGL